MFIGSRVRYTNARNDNVPCGPGWMMLPFRNVPTTYPGTNILGFSRELAVLVLLPALFLLPAIAQHPAVSPPPAVTTDDVVHKLVAMNVQRQQALQAFRGTRIYRAEYHGLGARNAEMVVRVNYQSPATKDFTIESATGSKLIIDRVFAKLLEAEREALNPDVQRRSALTEDNYHFTLTGYEDGPAGAKYVLEVEPRTKDKFLYRGRIWVDATDFAVVRLEAQPAKNPSFWTKNTEVMQEYTKVGGFWLPAQNRSVSTIRLGGRAELSIEYKDYDVTPVADANGGRTHLQRENSAANR
jgi:hypothetical protein